MSTARDFVRDVARRIAPRDGSYERLLRRARQRALRRRLAAGAAGLALTGTLVAGLLVAARRGDPRPADRPDDPTGWSRVVVQDEGYVGSALSLAVDAEGGTVLVYGGVPHEEAGEGVVVLDDGTRLPATVRAVVEGSSVTTSSVWDRAVGDGEGSAIAMDAGGTTHVAWTDGRLFYTNDDGGDFVEPQVVDDFPVHPGGMSMAVTPDGTPWFAFYGDGMEVVTREGDGWVSERIDRPEVGNPVQASIALAGDEIFVAYGSGRETRLAHLRGGRWSVDTVDQNGSSGVDLAVDPDGEPTIVYVGRDGTPRFAEPAAQGGWEITALPGSRMYMAPAIAIDDSGAHHFVVSDGSGHLYVTDARGELEAEQLPSSADWPYDIAVSEATVHVAWQRVSEAEGDAGVVEMATRTIDTGAPDA